MKTRCEAKKNKKKHRIDCTVDADKNTFINISKKKKKKRYKNKF